MSELDRGYLYERTEFDPLEKFLADEWERIAVRDLFMIIGRPPTKDDRWTAASLFQWLGTNVGFGTLSAIFRKAGYSITGSSPSPICFRDGEELVQSMKLITELSDCEREANQLTFDLSEPT